MYTLFFFLGGFIFITDIIDAATSTTYIGNSIFIRASKSMYFESCYYFDLELFYFRKICSPSQSSSCFI